MAVYGEARQQREKERRDPKPQLPTPDAPGRTPVAPPAQPPACCASPDLVDAATVDNAHGIPCRACGRGTLRIIRQWIA